MCAYRNQRRHGDVYSLEAAVNFIKSPRAGLGQKVSDADAYGKNKSRVRMDMDGENSVHAEPYSIPIHFFLNIKESYLMR